MLYHKRLEEIRYSGAGKAIIDHYNALARHLDVTVMSIVPPHKCRRPPGLWGVAFRYHVACSASAREALLYPLRLASSLMRRLEPLLLAALLSLGIGPGAAMGEAVAGGYDAVVVEQPYLDTRGLPRESLAVRMHNIEAEYVEMLASLEDMELPEAVKRLIGASEGERLRRARGLVALSFRDALLAEKLYGVKACYAPPVITPAEPAAQWEPPAPPRSYVVYVVSPTARTSQPRSSCSRPPPPRGARPPRSHRWGARRAPPEERAPPQERDAAREAQRGAARSPLPGRLRRLRPPCAPQRAAHKAAGSGAPRRPAPGGEEARGAPAAAGPRRDKRGNRREAGPGKDSGGAEEHHASLRRIAPLAEEAGLAVLKRESG